jgi:hypothetical protein
MCVGDEDILCIRDAGVRSFLRQFPEFAGGYLPLPRDTAATLPYPLRALLDGGAARQSRAKT